RGRGGLLARVRGATPGTRLVMTGQWIPGSRDFMLASVEPESRNGHLEDPDRMALDREPYDLPAGEAERLDRRRGDAHEPGRGAAEEHVAPDALADHDARFDHVARRQAA